MERKEFLSLLGMGASGLALSCMGGCVKDQGDTPPPPVNVDFMLDLNDVANEQLRTNGGFVYRNGIIIAHTLDGRYLAVQQLCTHANFSVGYVPNGDLFYCTLHGGTFADNGAVLTGPPKQPLATYKTSLNGNLLRIFS